MRFLEIQNATVWRGDTAALVDFSLTLEEGESVAILGPNGAGKSTFLKLLTGELRPEARPESRLPLVRRGTLVAGGTSPPHRRGDARGSRAVRGLGDARAMSCSRHCGGPTAAPGTCGFPRAEKERAVRAMDSMGVEHLGERPFGALSSGEKRRLLIARALVHEPGVLVLDEPSTALDFSSSLQLSITLRRLLQSGRTLVWVTHHPGEIPPEIQRVMLLRDGRVFADGPKRKILSREVLGRLYDVHLKVRWSGGWCDARFE